VCKSNTFLENIKDQLEKQKKSLESIISAKKNTIASKHSIMKDEYIDTLVKKESSIRSMGDLKDKLSVEHIIDIPYYLKKVKDGPRYKMPAKNKIELNMALAQKRHEKCIKDIQHNEEKILNRQIKAFMDWKQLYNIKAHKQKLNVVNIRELLIQQIKENVIDLIKSRKNDW